MRELLKHSPRARTSIAPPLREVFGVPLEAVNNEQRRYAKIINFGLIYGMSEFGLASQLGIERAAARAVYGQLLCPLSGGREIYAADQRNRQGRAGMSKPYSAVDYGAGDQ